MSIINDALKKAEKESSEQKRLSGKPQPDKNIAPASSDKPVPQSSPEQPKQKISKKYIMITAALLAVLAVSVAVIIITEKIKNVESEPPPPVPKEASNIIFNINSADKESEEAASDKKRNPSEPITKMGDLDDVILNGIMYSGEEPLAVINNQVVREGEFYEGMRVLKINRTNIVVEINKLKITIHLKQ